MVIRAGDVLFVDTCVLLTATVETREHHHEATLLLAAHGRRGIHLGVSAQIIREYLVVATRPRGVNGLGLTPDDALANVDEFRRRCVLYDETEAVAGHLARLVRVHQLRGKRIHDANVVATMLTHGLTNLVTENPADFGPFLGVETLDSAEAAVGMPSSGTV